MKKEYSFYLADDHKGNKVLIITKGKISYRDLNTNNVHKIADPKFAPIAKQLRNLIDETTVKTKEGAEQCN